MLTCHFKYSCHVWYCLFPLIFVMVALVSYCIQALKAFIEFINYPGHLLHRPSYNRVRRTIIGSHFLQLHSKASPWKPLIFCWQLVAEIERLSILGNLLLSTGNIATLYVTWSNLLPATRLLATSCLVYGGLNASVDMQRCHNWSRTPWKRLALMKSGSDQRQSNISRL